MSSPWGKIVTQETVNIQDIMSEELAKDLKVKEARKHISTELIDDDFEIVPEFLEMPELFQSDEEIAKQLQQQLNKEYDNTLKDVEDKFNHSLKDSILFPKRQDSLNCDVICSSNKEDIDSKEFWDKYSTILSEFDPTPAYSTMKNKKYEFNMVYFDIFSLKFVRGYSAGSNIKISNKLFNNLFTLEMHNKYIQPKLYQNGYDYRHIPFGVDAENVTFNINNKTGRILIQMKKEQQLEQVNGVISVGKEAIIFRGKINLECAVPKDCVIKIFKPSLLKHKNKDNFITDSSKFTGKSGKLNIMRMICYWAENEKHNLQILQKAGIPCPEVIALNEYVLITSLIGTDNEPAPMLSSAGLHEKADLVSAFRQVVRYMKTMYTECNLIHTDLSEHNILWYESKCYIIDVSQAVEVFHPNALEYLYKDCERIFKFFWRQTYSRKILSAQDIFADITGCAHYDKKDLEKLQASINNRKHRLKSGEVSNSDNLMDH